MSIYCFGSRWSSAVHQYPLMLHNQNSSEFTPQIHHKPVSR